MEGGKSVVSIRVLKEGKKRREEAGMLGGEYD